MAERSRADQGWRGRRSWLRWIGRHEVSFLVGIGIIAGGIWAFAQIADEVGEGDAHGFDRTILLAMRSPGDPADPIGPKWLEETARDFTALGGTPVLTVLVLAVTGFLALAGKKKAAAFLLIAVGGGMLLSVTLKAGFSRPRPDLVPHAVEVYSASFPSGHSMLSAVTYLTLGTLLASVQSRRLLKAYFLLIAAAISMLVGVTRIYLGVHWPTDVLAGWTAGATWALCCWLAARWLQRRGRIERSVASAEDAPDEM